ncbi:MAG: hypothetical protein MRY72_12900, partial [Aquisalinus sp.]|nr:hypothetical protein [Aquisalinus sp.]
MDAGVYHAGGQLSSATFGNGHSYSGTITSRLQPLRTIISQGSTLAVDQTLVYDAMGRVTSLTDLADIGNNRSFGYDALGRLTSASGPWGTGGAQSSGSFTYDPLANIRQKVLGSRTVTVAYDTATNRATSSSDTAGGTRSLAYDARGNVTTLGGLTFSYDMSDQPVSQFGSVHATFTYDGNLKRVKQVMDGKTIYSVYDAS